MALFRPFRALGHVTDDTPFATQRRGREAFVTLSVGQSWQVYNCAKLTLTLVGPQFSADITSLAVKGDLTYAALGPVIVVCKRVHRVAQLRGASRADIVQMLPLGDHLLALGGGTEGSLQVWAAGQWGEGPQAEIHLGGEFHATCMAHPDTYLNKVVIGSADGRVQLWNFVSKNMLYEFSGWGSSVRCIVSSPALDVVGIGLNDGRAVLHNLRIDEEVATFENASGAAAVFEIDKARHLLPARPRSAHLSAALPSSRGAAVSSIAFRDTSCEGAPIMAAAGASGAITFWNLEERRLHSVLRDAHNGRVCSLHFFPGEPLLMSSGSDNSVRQWLMDAQEGPPRLLRFRAGHAAPPTIIKHYGNGTAILSAGSDLAFRVFSVIQDAQSKELSQRNVEKRAKRLKIRPEELKLSRVIALDDCQVRERDWANIITAHEGDATAYTWLLKDAAIGEHALTPPPSALREGEPPPPVTSVAISRCGNFGIVGSASGAVHRYNLQSGRHRGVYRPVDGGEAHDGAVVGVAPDSHNRALITCGYDGWLRRWDFRRRRPTGELEIGAHALRMVYHCGSGLVGVACDDLSISLFDAEALTRVRRFNGHTDRITELQISADARWLLSASMDGTLRVWDIPAAAILQVLDLGAPVTSFSLSPAMEMLATSHPERNGISLWSNNAIFSSSTDVAVSRSDTPVRAKLELPRLGRAKGEEEDGEGSDTDSGSASEEAEEGGAGVALPSLTDSGGRIIADSSVTEPRLVTLSLLPRSQWESLAVLEAIKERNKPTQPAKKPEAAPFFLPTNAAASMGRQPVFDVEGGEGVGGGGGSRIMHTTGSGGDQSEFSRMLELGAETGDFAGLAALLQSMSPSAVDMEIRARELFEGSSEEEVGEVAALLQFVEAQVGARRDFEFVQAFFRMLLKIHADAIIEHDALAERAKRIRSMLRGTWEQLDAKFNSIRCMIGFFSSQA